MTTILLVDDEEDIRESYKEMFEAMGYTVILAQDGREAIELYRRELPDVVIMDVLMPKLTGVQTTELLKKEFPDARIIGMSGGWIRQKDFFLQVARSSGASAVIAKPFQKEELVAMINKVINDKKEVQ